MKKKLINAVKRNLGGDVKQKMKDIANHGIDGGFGGFIYYSDTVKFFKNNRAEIIELVREMAQEFGQDPIEFVASFNCLKHTDFAREEIARALYGKLKSDDIQVANALAWFAGEEVARHETDGE